MKTRTIYFSNHAAKQMFQRDISVGQVQYVLENGEIIFDYADDKPYPSSLILAFCDKRPLHVVFSIDLLSNHIIVITAYEPSIEIWESDFKTNNYGMCYLQKWNYN